MSKSNIEWTDWTSNPLGVKGSLANYCARVSPGCKHCYAEVMSRRLAAISKDPTWAPYKVMDTPPAMGVRYEVLKAWKKMRKPRKIFVGSMTDVFGEWVSYYWLMDIFTAMLECPNLTFQILTKRPDRMREFIDFFCYDKKIQCLPANIWCGISAENQEWYDKRLDNLLSTKCAVRFLSCEPLLGPINLHLHNNFPVGTKPGGIVNMKDIGKMIHWVIVGGESGAGDRRPMHPRWVRSIHEQCKSHGVAFFFKQWGNYADGSSPVATNIIVLDNGEYQESGSRVLQKKYLPNQWDLLFPTVMHKVKDKKADALIDGLVHQEFPPVTT